MKILPNLLTVDSDRANFPLHGGIKDFFVQSNESKGALKSTVRYILLRFFLADDYSACQIQMENGFKAATTSNTTALSRTYALVNK